MEFNLNEAREAKKPKQVKPKEEPAKEIDPSAPKYKVKFHHCDEFNDTFKDHFINTPGVDENLTKFKKSKFADPLKDYGNKDYPLGNHFEKQVPGILHAGLTHDKSVFYTLSGAGDTRHIHLYGIYGHDEAGIGQPPNIKKQNSLAKKLGNQEFED